MTTAPAGSSRAVLRLVEAGNIASCVACDEQVKFSAKTRRQQVICNVYAQDRWVRVEHFHAECYDEQGQPHGDPA